MSSKSPIVRQASYLYLILHTIIICILIFLFAFVTDMLKAIYFGVLTYYVIALLLQRFIPLNHKKGIKFVKKGDFASAIEQHQQSYEFFTKHKKLDKYRFITMLSTSRISYTEMSLFNIAYCYAQSGNGALSKQYYEKVLAQFPNSGMAKSALNSIKAFEAKPDNPDE